jgi:hypothetical protein
MERKLTYEDLEQRVKELGETAISHEQWEQPHEN